MYGRNPTYRSPCPKFPVGEGQTAEQLLAELAFNPSLKERLKTKSPNEMYVKRLQYELEVIQSMGFVIFLNCCGLHELCTENTLLTGPGPGSLPVLSLPFPLDITDVINEHGFLFIRSNFLKF